ncbi:MAG: DUF1737 domain-containing protein [Alphaproteobacteria bacterium]|jgi:hypothetical protein|nr:DUF1737 domain-containing protein [Alphaproteobacteria bacterium]
MNKSYRFLTGPDDAAFCQKVSDALAEGYELYGNPMMVVSNGERYCGQAVIMPNTTIGDGDREDD